MDENFVIVPNAGFIYGNYTDSAYKEKGAGVYNLEVGTKKTSRLTAKAGVSLLFPNKLDNGMTIVPSVKAGLTSEVLNNKQKVNAKFQWMDNYFDNKPEQKDSKLDRVGFSFGTGILIKKDNLEVSTNYDGKFNKNYQSHQGSLKLKLNF